MCTYIWASFWKIQVASNQAYCIIDFEMHAQAYIAAGDLDFTGIACY